MGEALPYVGMTNVPSRPLDMGVPLRDYDTL